MAKKLYMVSLGPGDVGLVTLRALEVLQSVDAISVPTKSEDSSFKKSMTYKVLKRLFKKYDFEKKLIPVYSPMRFDPDDWEMEADIVLDALAYHDKVAFVTLGDSAIYSSVYYILDIIKEKDPTIYHDSEVVAGVTSFSQASAKVKEPICLGDSAFEVVPLLDKKVSKTTIYMRPKIGMDMSFLQEKGKIFSFENLNFDGENIEFQKLKKVRKYMTLFVDFFRV